MGISIGVGPPLCTSSPNGCHEGAQNQCRATLVQSHHHRPHFSCLRFRKTSFSSRCNIGQQFVVTPPRICKSFFSAKPRQRKIYVSGVDNLGLEPLVEENCSEEEGDASEAELTSEKLSTSEQIEADVANEITTSQSLGTNGSPIPDDDISESNGEEDEVRQSRRSSEDEFSAENWQMFAAEEGARPLTGATESDQDSSDSEQGSDVDSDVEDGFNQGGVKRRKAEDLLPLPDGKPGNWTPAKAEKVKFLHKYEYR